MLSRRSLLAGVAACAVPLALPLPAHALPPGAIDVILKKVSEDLARDAEQSELPLPGAWGELAYRWSTVKDLRTKVEQTVAELFKNLEDPPVLKSGCLSLEVQYRINEYLPVDYYLERDFFDALVACAPPRVR